MLEVEPTRQCGRIATNYYFFDVASAWGFRFLEVGGGCELRALSVAVAMLSVARHQQIS